MIAVIFGGITRTIYDSYKERLKNEPSRRELKAYINEHGSWLSSVYKSGVSGIIRSIDRFFGPSDAVPFDSQQNFSWRINRLAPSQLLALIYPLLSIILVFGVFGKTDPLANALGFIDHDSTWVTGSVTIFYSASVFYSGV